MRLMLRVFTFGPLLLNIGQSLPIRGPGRGLALGLDRGPVRLGSGCPVLPGVRVRLLEEAFVSALAGPLQVVGAHMAVVADPVWVAAAFAVAGDAVPSGGELVSHQAAPSRAAILAVMSVTVTGVSLQVGWWGWCPPRALLPVRPLVRTRALFC